MTTATVVDFFGAFVGFCIFAFGMLLRMHYPQEADLELGYGWIFVGVALILMNGEVVDVSTWIEVHARAVGYLIIGAAALFYAPITLRYVRYRAQQANRSE